jgi:peptide/nickel transport system permease protein
MLEYIVRRVIVLIPLLFVITVISFLLIQLPPGDFLSTYIMRLRVQGIEIQQAEIDQLKAMYALDRPIYVQYLRWIGNILLRGDFGRSFQWKQPVSEIIGERIVLTMVVSLLTIVFTWMISIPTGIYSATHQYSAFDFFFTFLGFIGLATPSFLLALVVLWLAFDQFGISAIGLFSPQFINAPWSLAKILDMLKHIWAPVLIIGTAGTAGLIRVMRGTLLDELRKQYVVTARAKGLKEGRLLLKYPVRISINPLVSTIGWMLPSIVSGETLVSIVLNIPTTGPILLGALLAQDMYLAGSFLLILSVLTVTGTLISDILLAWLDPRIRYEGSEHR